MQIVKLGTMVGAGIVDEVDIAKIDVNQYVTLRLDALPDVQLHGHIRTSRRASRPSRKPIRRR